MPTETRPKGLIRTTAEVVAYNKDYVWLKLPELWPSYILTLDREWLAHGYAQYAKLVVEADPDSLTNRLGGYLADVYLVEGLDEPEEAVDAE